MDKKKSKQKKLWGVFDEAYLIELWAEKEPELRGNRKNGHIYKEMSAAFEGRLQEYTPEEIRVKIHNLTTKYKKEKKIVGPSGGSPSEWPLYSKIHAILGEHLIYNLELLVEDSRPSDSMRASPPAVPSSSENTNSSMLYSDNASAGPSGASGSRPKKRKASDGNEISSQIVDLLTKFNSNEEKYIQQEDVKIKILKDFVEDAKKTNKAMLDFLNKAT